ncbi:hypothetical protein [uncultured Sphaerochaeta sp.]|uniref:hypothetical protein n=1 Tax=uncultured Sphaerochaeta sp. TaxID=886478 RepID=UPI002A0A0FAF|nr:hypothetical protein [uncultured Sphaerochaeta sp.]
MHVKYGMFGSEAIVLLEKGSSLIVLSIPPDLVDGYAQYVGLDRQSAVQTLVGFPSDGMFGTNRENLARLRELTEILAVETLGVSKGMVTDQIRLDALVGSARVLRKTALPDTLQRLSGLDSILDRILDVKYCHAYDLGQFITIDAKTDWEALGLYIRQWLAEALLLDLRRNIS